MTERTSGDGHDGPPSPEMLEAMVRGYLADLKVKAFGATA